MAGRSSIVKVSFQANTAAMRKGIDDVNGRLSKFSKAAKVIGGAIAGAFVFDKAVEGVKDLVNAGQQAQNAINQTNAVLKSTKGAANIGAEGVTHLADTLGKKIGVDDTSIRSNENLLLTFRNVRNEVGKGNDIFSRATKTVSDMSQALGEDGKSASIQLGKALNDPIKGITALSRVGVSFTEKQKAQIKTMVASGHTLGAQKMILKELGKEFGGSAVAAATPVKKLKAQWEDFKETLGLKLLPIVYSVASFLSKNLPVAIADTTSAFESVKKFVAPVVTAISGFISSLRSGSGEASGFSAKVTSTINSLKPVFQDLQTIVQDSLGIVTQAFKIAVKVIQVLWSIFGRTILGYLRGTFNNIITIVKGAFKIVEGLFEIVDGILHGNWKQVWQGIKDVTKGALTVLKGLIKQGLNVIRTAFALAWDAVKALTKLAFRALVAAVKDAISNLVSVVKGIKSRVLGALGNAAGWLAGVGHDIVSGLAHGIEDAFGLVKAAAESLASHLPGWVKKVLHISSPSKVMRELGKWIPKGLAQGILDGKVGVKKAMDALTDVVIKSVKSKLKTLQSAAKQVASTVKDSITSFGDISQFSSAVVTSTPANAVIAGLQAKVTQARKFVADMKTLAKLGLSKTGIAQLFAAGPDAGFAVAEALVAGGKSAIRQVNTLTSQLNSIGGSGGSAAANSAYGAGITQAKGVIAGLKKHDATWKQIGSVIGAGLTADIERHYGIRQNGRAATANNYYTITVHAPVGSSGADIGRTLTKYIDEYEKKGGRKKK